MKDWGEGMSELMIVKEPLQETVTILSWLGVFTYSKCCILICLM